MAKTFPADPSEFVITDVGSTTTKALLFRRESGAWRCDRFETPTTVEKPHEDVAVGVRAALAGLERATGRRLLDSGAPCVPYLTTSSAGGGLSMVVTGLVEELTAETAERTALGAGAIVLGVIAMNDGRTPYRKIEDLRRLRPDMVLFCGGFDADALSGPVFLAELLVEAGLAPKLNPSSKLPVVYAGNVKAADSVRQSLGERFLFQSVPNVRPDLNVENLEPARRAIHALFMDHVMSQAPGYDTLRGWVAAPILPTPSAFAELLALVSKRDGRRVMAIDIGGATTDVFTAHDGEVFRTVSANLGLSYSLLNVARVAGVAPMRDLYHPHLTESELWNRIGNKHINPTRLARTPDEMRTEWAAAVTAIREAVREHLAIRSGADGEEGSARVDVNDLLRDRRELIPHHAALRLADYGLVIGSGGILSHSPRPAALAMLLDALAPSGAVEFAVDSEFMFPHLGALGRTNPALALELFRTLGLVRLGTTVCRAGAPVSIKARTARGRDFTLDVPAGAVKLAPLEPDDELHLTLTDGSAVTARGGQCGLVVDTRPRPITAGAAELLPADYVPRPRPESGPAEPAIVTGELTLRRELVIPGTVLVKPGDRVETATVVARSVRQFLRPMFLHVAEGLGVPPGGFEQYLLKKVGDEVGEGDVVARRKVGFLDHKTFHSPIAGRIEKLLPSGVVLVRERPEHAREFTAVQVAKEMGIEARDLAPYLRVEPGQEVDRGQWLAARMEDGFKFVASPVRGKVNRIDSYFGIVLIEPLLEELQVRAWLPGIVTETTDRGAVVANTGTVVQGAWGFGPEAAGPLSLDRVQKGAIVFSEFADSALVKSAHDQGAAGIVCAGLDLADVIDTPPAPTVVVLEGFGPQRLPPAVRELVTARAGRLALVDGFTQLRVGVRRPRLILPEPVGDRNAPAD
ncbi:MAG: glutamate mutase L [bacterium]